MELQVRYGLIWGSIIGVFTCSIHVCSDEGIHCSVFMKRENHRKWDSIVFFFMLVRYLKSQAVASAGLVLPEYVLYGDVVELHLCY